MEFIKKKLLQFIDWRIGRIIEPINRNDRLGMLHRAWGYVFTNMIKGAYYEFGVYKGDTFVQSWQVYKNYLRWVESQLSSPEQWRRETIKDYADFDHDFYGFDTFAGMPANDEGNKYFTQGTYLAPYAEVKNKCEKAKMRFKLYQGTFSDVSDSTMMGLQPAAVVNIDADLYGSARDALEKVMPKLQQGTILLMDDYNCFSSSQAKGERRALLEFCKKYPQFEFEPWFVYQHVGQAFICHLKEAAEA